MENLWGESCSWLSLLLWEGFKVMVQRGRNQEKAHAGRRQELRTQSSEYGATKVFRVHRREDWREYKMHRQNSKYLERAAFDSSGLWSACWWWNHVKRGKNYSKGLEEKSPGMHKSAKKSACSHQTGKHHSSWYWVMYTEGPCLSSEK